MITLVIAVVPFFLIWLAVINDWRVIRHGEVGILVFALQLVDIIFILSADRIFNYIAVAVRRLGRNPSLRGVDSEAHNQKKVGAAGDEDN